MNYCYQR